MFARQKLFSSRLFLHSFALVTTAAVLGSACSSGSSGSTTSSSSGNVGGAGETGGTGGTGGINETGGAGGAGGAGGMGGAVDPGPMVDSTDPKVYETKFTAADADPEAKAILSTQLGYLNTTVPNRGVLVVYLHGAGVPTTCGSTEHGKVLAKMGFHVLSPCYVSDYGVGNCGSDIEGCRLEAFDGVDHHAFVNIAPADSIEERVAKGLVYLQNQVPQGDWKYFLDGDKPKWSKILISGISHGASTSAVIGLHKQVFGVVSLSGPLDSGQAWLGKTPMTPRDRFFAFTHSADTQHTGHLKSFADMGLPGMPTSVDGATAPYGESHQLITSAATNDGHGSTQAGGSSPKDANGAYVFLPVWETMYTGLIDTL